MFFKKKIPKWVLTFPYEMDKAALISLAESSTRPFDSPREMNFVLYGFKTIKLGEEAATHFEKVGWRCSFEKQKDDINKFLLVATKDNYRITDESYRADSALFQRIADLHKVSYDGWFAESKPDSDS